MTNAEKFFHDNEAFILSDFMELLDSLDLEVNQEWDIETTTWIFPDDSYIAINNDDIVVDGTLY